MVTLAFGSTAQITIKDADLGTGTYNWTKDNVYLLDGFVFLEAGGTLNIEAGTVIKAKENPSTSDLASALIIARGATLNVNGTAEEPVIMTSELDDVTNATDLDHTDRGLWGGLVILGSAPVEDDADTIIVEGFPTTETRAEYGGTNATDNSGTIRYLSVRHGGTEYAPGEEINGITLGGVGSGTVIEHVDVFANLDDGIEFFGGTVSIKWACVAYCGDDCFDYDTGWRGNGQFWFAIIGADDGDCGGEHDGAKPDSGPVYSKPTIYNATYIGAGIGAAATNSTGILFRDGTGGTYGNSIITDFAKHAIEIEDRNAGAGVDSRKRMEDGDLKILNNVWWNFGSPYGTGKRTMWTADTVNGLIRATPDAEDSTCAAIITHLTTNMNVHSDPGITSISRAQDNGLDPRPSATGPATTSLAAYPSGSWWSSPTYKGAFDPSAQINEIWIAGWTALAQTGYLPASAGMVDNQVKELPLTINPNPVKNNGVISFTLDAAEEIEISIVNLTGQVVKVITNEQFSEGVQHVSFDMSEIAAGIYVVQLNAETLKASSKLVVVE